MITISNTRTDSKYVINSHLGVGQSGEIGNTTQMMGINKVQIKRPPTVKNKLLVERRIH